MAKIKKNGLGKIGYSIGFQMLTNFVFEIQSVEYSDNLYGYFTIKLTNDCQQIVTINDISVCGDRTGNFQARLLEKGNFIFNPTITNENIIDIFSFEFDQFKIAFKIKELQKEQLAYGNQSAALEKSESISFEDKKTLRSHYSTKQTELQECINKLTFELTVVDSEIIVEKPVSTD